MQSFMMTVYVFQIYLDITGDDVQFALLTMYFRFCGFSDVVA